MKTQEAVMPRTLLQALAAVLLAPALAFAQSAGAPALHDGVVVDAAGGAAYVMNRQGVVAAIDLATGASRWTSAAAAKPLVVTDSTLVAQAPPGTGEQLVLVSLDTERGAEKKRSKVALPDDLKARVTDTPTQRTQVRAFLAAGGNVVVSWAIQSRLARGAAPDNGTAEANGAAHIDPETGEVSSLAAGSTPSADEGSVSGLTLAQMMQQRSVDGRHVAQSERSGDLRQPYRWTVTDATGQVVGVVDSPISVAPFIVSGSRLLYVAPASGYRDGDRFVQEPLRLRAIDLASGAQLWAVPVLDASFVLPPP